jgi:hypothetical protein
VNNFWENSEWKPLLSSTRHSNAAVYQVRIVIGKQALAIPRFLGNDADGVLTIGEAGNLEKRRKQFIRAMDENRAKHSEGKLLYYILQHSSLLNIHPRPDFEFRFRKEVNKPSAKQSEEKLIKAYILKFGEPPPLNCLIPNRHGNWD